MTQDYDMMIMEKAQVVFMEMEKRVPAEDVERIRAAFELAREAHAAQKRKSGEPYIIHPIAVATIVAIELKLGANPVIAAFLHDVVEDTAYTIDDIRQRFGDDVAFLVSVVTKKSTGNYEISKQVDNYKQMLNSIHYDIRALLVKLADRLHNMRTLSSMRPDKQMKIAGETDFFYAPLANRLGLYNVKIELENLSFRYRCPHEYELITSLIQKDQESHQERLDIFTARIREALANDGIKVLVRTIYHAPYSIWRKMRKSGDDFNHVPFRHFVEVMYACEDEQQEKDMALRIYSHLTDAFNEKPCGIINYIDSPKENGYQSFHVQLLSDFGCWEEVHISSERMVRASQLGVVAERSEDNVRRWIEKFRTVLRDMEFHQKEGDFIENVVTTFYNDDILVFTPNGMPVNLPKKATALDFAFEIHSHIGEHAHYARINEHLASVKTELHRGDIVEIVTNPDIHPLPEWTDHVLTYKAKGFLKRYFAKQEKSTFHFCPHCQPIPGEEVIGFKETDGTISVHKRNCPIAIGLASQQGDSIVSVDYEETQDALYPVGIQILAIDRFHLLSDMINCITNEQHLSIGSLSTTTADCIVQCTIHFSVHSFGELQTIISQVAAINGVEEVKRI
ncbi:MAG: bifunctional (p)ppGpp synthetase/guanosine-3',5'-bis(diphosphate) 3'-pyrophosphohydrolase [Prevotella sp.]|nr:bifunctional (p)ppGpp synthetase/guanosine-3',5'-bis(diphosphate) 3'-pyrophosphohydrolase [Prevotella sp.]